MATTKIAYPALSVENLWRRFLATKVQKITAGTSISNTENVSDLASGPNTSLPLQKKICKRQEFPEIQETRDVSQRGQQNKITRLKRRKKKEPLHEVCTSITRFPRI